MPPHFREARFIGMANGAGSRYFGVMQMPRWLQIVVAVCLIVIAIDATFFVLGPARDHRFSTGPEHFSVVDGRTGRMCQMNGPSAVVCWNPMAGDTTASK
jgi:hypothetical protein